MGTHSCMKVASLGQVLVDTIWFQQQNFLKNEKYWSFLGGSRITLAFLQVIKAVRGGVYSLSVVHVVVCACMCQMHIFCSEFQIFQWADASLKLPEALRSPSEMSLIILKKKGGRNFQILCLQPGKDLNKMYRRDWMSTKGWYSWIQLFSAWQDIHSPAAAEF